ncbi:uncharacterized protein METZ01_LOCUS409119, partial [marine metagenome]
VVLQILYTGFTAWSHPQNHSGVAFPFVSVLSPRCGTGGLHQIINYGGNMLSHMKRRLGVIAAVAVLAALTPALSTSVASAAPATTATAAA